MTIDYNFNESDVAGSAVLVQTKLTAYKQEFSLHNHLLKDNHIPHEWHCLVCTTDVFFLLRDAKESYFKAELV